LTPFQEVHVPVQEPTPGTRWRCTRCGNLTRFDVTRSSRVTEYVHLDLGGAPRVEERVVHAERIELVRCRWCDATDSVELVARTDVQAQTFGRGVEDAAAAEDAAQS
jgi:hypothetical protein